MAVIDTSGQSPSNNNSSTQPTTQVVKEVKVVEHQAPKELILIYNNLNQLLDLSQNYKEILEVAQSLERNLMALSNVDMVAIRQLPINEILEVASRTNDISKLSLIRNDIERISKLDRELVIMSTMFDEIQRVSEISEEIIKVNTMSDAIEIVSKYENELVQIFVSLDEILLVEQELSYVIQLAKLLGEYKKFLTNNNLTDAEYASFIKNIEQNINEIRTISNSIEEIKKLNEKINQTPDILQQYQDRLDLLVLEAKTRFEQLLVDGVDRLNEATQKGEKDLIDLAHQLKVLIGNTGNGGVNQIYVDTKIKELSDKIDQLKQEILTKLADYATKAYVDGKTGDLTQLTTTQNNNLTEAINELKTNIDAGLGNINLTDYAKKNEANTFTAKQDFQQGATTITPTTGTDVANKDYVDTKIQTIDLSPFARKDTANTFAEKQTFNQGGTITTLPTDNSDIANKEYVDQQVATKDLTNYAKKNETNDFTAKQNFNSGATVTGTPTANTDVVNKQALDTAVANVAKTNIANTFTQNQTFNEFLIVTKKPTDNNHLANKQYVDEQVATKDLTDYAKKTEPNTFNGDQTFNGNLISSTAPTANDHLANKQYVDNEITNLKSPKLKVLNDITFIASDIVDKGAFKHEITIESNKYISILDVYIEDTQNQCIVSIPYDVIVKNDKCIIFLDVENIKKITYLEIDL